MGIVAAFDKVLFYNQANRYSVMRLKTADIMIPDAARDTYHFKDHLIRFVAVGYDLPQTDAIQMDITGKWVDGKYGLRLQVEGWREIIPPTIEGIRAYLSSGLIKNIGEKTADAIIERFGIDSLNIIEKQPERLLEIRGITEERLEEIKRGYAESIALRDLMTILAPFKVTPATAMRIYEHFGPGGVALIRQSPYRLCQVSGFGFKRVDAIVQKSGGNLYDPMRIQGSLFYAVEKSRSEGGHLFIEAGALIAGALQLLNEKIPVLEKRITAEQVRKELETMILTDVVVSNKGNIYLPHVFTQESETAVKAVKMLLEVPGPVNLAPVIEQVKAQLGITLSKRQAEGVEAVFRHNLSIITGGPGTGKSTILKAVIEIYRILYPKKTIKLAAPTGKASRRMAETTGIEDAQTLHSLLKLHGEDTGRQKKGSLNADLVIVDEASMMDMWLAHQLFSQIEPGTQLLLVGDVDQLESVGAGSVFSELIQCGLIPVTVLDEIFRQSKDSLIPYNAREINNQRAELKYSEDFAYCKTDTQDETAEAICGFYKREVARIGMEQVQILSPFRSEGAASAMELNEAIRAEVNPASPLRLEVQFGGKLFRVQDRVMQTKNDYDIVLRDQSGEQIGAGVFNGEVGIVSKIESGTVTVNFDGRFADYPLENLNELELSYAMTIHKAMGSEYDTVIMPLLPAHKVLLSRNLLYTAVTRAKHRVILVGNKRALYMAVHKSGKGKRNTLLAERMRLYYQAMAKQPSSAAADLKKAG